MTRSSKQTAYFFRATVLFFLLTLTAVGCKKGFDKYYEVKSSEDAYLYNVIKSNPNFSIFAQGLERANLVDFLDKGGLYTVFAPTNEAITQFLASNSYASINDVPLDNLFRILSFHIVNNMWYYYDFQKRFTTYNQKLYLTRDKKFVSIDVATANTLSINGVPVISTLRDIDAGNGVIHGIGSVLIPLPNLEQLFQTDPALANSTFYKMMQVLADSSYDRFNSYDRDRDGKIDSIFYKTYPLLDNVYASIEFRQNTLPENQGGDPVFSTALVPANYYMDSVIAPAIARIDPTVQNKIKALSPSYVEAVLESYFLYDTSKTINSATLITRPTPIRSVNNELVPALPDILFVRKDLAASNGSIHVINTAFPKSDRLKSALGLAMIDPELSMFMEAVQKAGLMSSFAASSRAGTFLAPTNTAFIEAGLDIKNRILNGVSLTATEFSNIIKNHVIDISLNPASLTGSRATNLGAAYPLVFSNGGTTVTSSAGTVATVTLPNVSVGPSNVGYVYKINKILIPKP
jgi:uncharacterized surface protein with fasciclin (FAS1) repeats